MGLEWYMFFSSKWMHHPAKSTSSLKYLFFPVTDVLNVSGKFNSDELSRDMSVGDDVKDEPFFEQREGVRSPQNVSALIGKTAFLSCIVRNLGKAKSVSNLTNPCLWVLKLPHYNLWS